MDIEDSYFFNPACPVAPADGTGVAPADGAGWNVAESDPSTKDSTEVQNYLI